MSYNNLCGAKQIKVWGTTQSIFKNGTSEVHYLEINKGGNSSLHCHERKWNRFFVVEGVLMIHMLDENENQMTLKLNRGDFLDIKPGCWHSFDADTDVKCLEVYWVDDINHNDIQRKNSGFLKE